jgi:glycosyltransferase involved in cell wall biosynthesis
VLVAETALRTPAPRPPAPRPPATRPVRTRRSMRIGIVAPSRYPVAEPYAGGLEAHTGTLARALVDRGHEVTLFAAPGSDPSLGLRELDLDLSGFTGPSRRDVSMDPGLVMAEHHAYLGVMLGLVHDDPPLDLLHNNSLHHLPVAMAPAVACPVVTTLHTPPFPLLESALRSAAVLGRGRPVTACAVSAHTAATWSPVLGRVPVVRNGVDTSRWVPGLGGSGAVWTGRIVPEKGLHHAVAAARAVGLPLRIAGPVIDTAYFESTVRPLLGGDVEHLGHLTHPQLVQLVGEADVALVTPLWDEPYGLVAAEALACGTPVAAYRRGGVPEALGPDCGRLAAPGDTAALAVAVTAAVSLSRTAAREHAVAHCSLTAMVDEYETLYSALLVESAA